MSEKMKSKMLLHTEMTALEYGAGTGILSFLLKDDLKQRGYRWDGDSKVWWTEIAEGACKAEVAWLHQLGVQSPLLTAFAQQGGDDGRLQYPRLCRQV